MIILTDPTKSETIFPAQLYFSAFCSAIWKTADNTSLVLTSATEDAAVAAAAAASTMCTTSRHTQQVCDSIAAQLPHNRVEFSCCVESGTLCKNGGWRCVFLLCHRGPRFMVEVYNDVFGVVTPQRLAARRLWSLPLSPPMAAKAHTRTHTFTVWHFHLS